MAHAFIALRIRMQAVGKQPLVSIRLDDLGPQLEDLGAQATAAAESSGYTVTR
ncbi:hypothetical protein [Microbacterium sp. 179-I 3D3 NHS]|uniref:hypothetical protein n=1 Tax=unclassified Microbacterium TaxID=2609290 RepID=UPI0039A2885B